MCWAEYVVVHHAASTARDPRERRRVGIRNTLWTTWLRRPLPAAARSLPRPDNPHLGYVITWYGLAAALVGVLAAFLLRSRREHAA